MTQLILMIVVISSLQLLSSNQRLHVIAALPTTSSSSFVHTYLNNNRSILKRKNIKKELFSISKMSTTPATAVVDTAEWVSPLVTNNNEIPTIPFPIFIATVGIVMPIWSVTILPITVLYQVGRTVIKKIGFGTKPVTPVIDSGCVVDTTSIISQEQRKYDIVVLGATGFTGRLAVRHLLKTYGTKGSDIKWAIAGRNENKLKSILIDIATECNLDSQYMTTLLNDIDIITVDTTIASTLPKLVSNAKCIATTAGPYSFYGNSVIEFCCKYGTHYVDITGEMDWIRLMIHTWSLTAKQSGSILIPFCGHDSIPWDISVSKMHDLLKEKNDELQSVRFYDASIGGAPGGTITTAFSIIDGTAQRTPKFDIDPYLRILNTNNDKNKNEYTKSTFQCIDKNPLGLEKVTFKSSWDTKSNKLIYNGHGWTMPFVMAPVNYQVVRWSFAQRQLLLPMTANSSSNQRMMSYKESNFFPNFPTACTSYVGLIMFGSFLLNPITAPIMKRYVLPKSGDGPSMDHMEKKNFLIVYGEGIGKNGNRVETIFYLPKDAGCLETSRMMIESAICLIKKDNQAALPVSGGFYSTATALGTNDILLNRLIATGTTFLSRVVPPKTP